MKAALLATLILLPQDSRQVSRPAPTGAAIIDRHVAERWAEEKLKPAPVADDGEWLRRVHLDVIGVIPPADVTLSFLADRRPDKRALMVDALLANERYADSWAELWEALLVGYDSPGPSADGTLGRWLRDEAFARNLPYDEMSRRLIAATGTNLKNGATRYLLTQLRRNSTPNDILDRTARVFLGTQIQCAACHDHPFDQYTQEDYYANVAFFVQTRQREVERDREYELVTARRAEAVFPPDPQAKNRRPMPPKSLDGMTPDGDEDRRAAFARILTRKDNLQFARAVVNRYWGHFFGRGLVHPIEEFNQRNKASHPDLLNELAQAFIDHKYDLKWLIRAICTSRPYQLSSRRPSKGSPPEKLFAHAQVRTMMPEQLFASIIEAVGVEDRYRAAERRGEMRDGIMGQKRGYIRSFRFAFGDDEKVDILDFHGTIPQALMMLNGDLLNQRMREPNGRLDLILRTRKSVEERLELIHLSALSRRPTPQEMTRYRRFVTQKGDKREAYEDVMWVLLNSSEFMFIH